MKKALMSLLCFCFLLISYSSIIAQDTTGHYLKPGDKMPDISFKIASYKTSTAKISDFKGKAVILDLWSVNCSGCIASIPHMQKLQKQFRDGLQIIMVTKNNSLQVAKLAKRSDNVKNNTLPSVMGDSIAYLFDYSVMPTHVWIDRNGRIAYIANGSDANKKNIEDFLAGKDIHLKRKIDFKIDHQIPLINNWYPYYKPSNIYTYLAPAQNEFTISSFIEPLHFNKETRQYKVSADYIDLYGLYKIAYGVTSTNGISISNSRIILRTKKADKFITDWNTKKNIFTYDLIADSSYSPTRIRNNIKAQLDLFLDVHSYRKDTAIFCYIIEKLSAGDLSYLSKSNIVKGDVNNGLYTVHNVPWQAVLMNISNETIAPLQVIDETGISPQTKVDITFNLNQWNNLPLLNKELAPYGLKVTKEKRMLDCIVIEDAE